MQLRVFVKIGRREEILGWDGDMLTVGINAPPIGGAANQRLISIISTWLGISKSKVVLTKGHTARHKILDITVGEAVFKQLLAKIPSWPKQQQLL